VYSVDSGYDPVADSCEHGNDPLGSIRGNECLHYLMTVNFSGKILQRGDTVSPSLSPNSI
jgi:hypothetical protein